MASSFKVDRAALKELLASPEVSKASVDIARRLAGNAQAVGHSEYEAAPATVPGGWRNEGRSGASVLETKPDPRDSRDSILLRVAQAMEGGK